jgi:hypothetical protein
MGSFFQAKFWSNYVSALKGSQVGFSLKKLILKNVISLSIISTVCSRIMNGMRILCANIVI